MVSLVVNGKTREVNAAPGTPLLWVLRDSLRMTGTKFGCGIAQCGACTVHLDGQPVRSCVTPLSAAAGKKVTTIEGVGGTRAGKAVQVTDHGEPLWILHPDNGTHTDEAERRRAIDEILDEVLREKPSKISAAKLLEQSRR